MKHKYVTFKNPTGAVFIACSQVQMGEWILDNISSTPNAAYFDRKDIDTTQFP